MTIIVAAAVIERGGRFLVTRRLEGSHLAGFWEFPGGKCEGSETLPACLSRELLEELDLGVAVGAEMLATTYAYGDRQVELHFFRCDALGEPVPKLGQQMRWVSPDELAELAFPPADAELIRLLTGAHRT